MSTENKWYHRLLKIFDRKPQLPTSRGIGGAVAKKSDSGVYGSYFDSVIARAGLQKSYADFTEEILNTLPDKDVRNLVKRANPIVAKAQADFADAVASGFHYTADRTLGLDLDTPAQALLDDFMSRLEVEQGGLEKLIGEMARGMFTHGGVFLELVIEKDKRTPAAIKVLDPTTAVFRRAKHDLLGEIDELGQEILPGDLNRPRRRVDNNYSTSSFNFVSLQDDPTIQYRPLQPEPNNPYGTPILDPAVFYVNMSANFMDRFMHAITGYIWPNVMINIDKEKFRKNIQGLVKTPDQIQTKLTELITQIRDHVKGLKPGDAIIQGDEVTFQGTVTGNNRSPLGSIKDIDDVIRRHLIVAVQSQPVLMGSNEGIAETHAIEQRRDYAKFIRRSQKTLNALITEFFNLILQLNDYPRLAEFRLSYTNTADYKDQALTFNQFRQGLLTASQDLESFANALLVAIDANFITEQQAQDMWDEGMEIRRQLNILPLDL